MKESPLIWTGKGSWRSCLLKNGFRSSKKLCECLEIYASLFHPVVEIAVVPWFHVTGLIHSFLAPVYFGSDIVPLAIWDAETSVQAIERYKGSHWVGVPTMVTDMLDLPGIGERDLSSLMAIGGGGAAMPVAVGGN